jgi:hypothetical protein
MKINLMRSLGFIPPSKYAFSTPMPDVIVWRPELENAVEKIPDNLTWEQISLAYCAAALSKYEGNRLKSAKMIGYSVRYITGRINKMRSLGFEFPDSIFVEMHKRWKEKKSSNKSAKIEE